MTKNQELMHLRSLIKTLGPDSYLGPWLQEVYNDVERNVIGDIFPDVSLDKCAKHVKEQMEHCNEYVATQKRNTGDLCKRMVEEAKANAITEVARIRENARNLLKSLSQQI